MGLPRMVSIYLLAGFEVGSLMTFSSSSALKTRLGKGQRKGGCLSAALVNWPRELFVLETLPGGHQSQHLVSIYETILLILLPSCLVHCRVQLS